MAICLQIYYKWWYQQYYVSFINWPPSIKTTKRQKNTNSFRTVETIIIYLDKFSAKNEKNLHFYHHYHYCFGDGQCFSRLYSIFFCFLELFWLWPRSHAMIINGWYGKKCCRFCCCCQFHHLWIDFFCSRWHARDSLFDHRSSIDHRWWWWW